MPLAPAATMPARVADQVGDVLAAHNVPDLVILAEVDQMRQWRIAPTANRSVVGIMNEFVFLADTWRNAAKRCRTHYLRNLLTKVPKSAQPATPSRRRRPRRIRARAPT
ncbi:hypothetical protein A6A27_39880 [Micromonospora sp. CB01531]|nr:hypothetical protein [Micromonospora sp. CB01531]OKI86612.1 hypothetical protein A6A27_39880 [Micromonospora sp. CB01531]